MGKTGCGFTLKIAWLKQYFMSIRIKFSPRKIKQDKEL